METLMTDTIALGAALLAAALALLRWGLPADPRRRRSDARPARPRVGGETSRDAVMRDCDC